jgi:hypothetical protein
VLQGRVLLEDAVPPNSWVSVENVAPHGEVVMDTTCRWVVARRLPTHEVGHFSPSKLQVIGGGVGASGTAEAGQTHEEAP